MYRIICLFFFYFLVNPGYAGSQFLLISDIHYGADNEDKEGEDTGPVLLRTSFKRIKQFSAQVDFILNLGDLPKHTLFFNEKKKEHERVVFHELYLADEALKPMFYIPGNNDSLSGNYQPFMVNGQSPLSLADDWQGACVFCDKLLIDKSHMASGGYYSSYVMPNNKEIILIALNTIPFAKKPMLMRPYTHQTEDAEEELSWLEQQLKNTKAKQLLIAMHIPPGVDYQGGQFWTEFALARFKALLNHYSSSFGQITVLSGHTHMDELHQLTLANGSTIYNYYAPSLSRNHHNNPAMKVVVLNKELQVANYKTYYTTKLDEWTNEHYQAKGSLDAVFPECTASSLAVCLDELSSHRVCQRLEGGLFYGVKSDKVPKNICEQSYAIG